MKNKIFFLIPLFLLFSNNISAQDNINAGELQKEAIKKIEFLTGNWKGTEWVLTPDGMKRNVESYDFAETKLKGTVILFQGAVKVKISESGDPMTVYEGLGLLSYNENTQKYRLQHFGSDGSYEDYECSLTGKTLFCEQKDKNNTTRRITIMVDDAGRWIEKGERLQDGRTWTQFFETQMDKTAP